MRARRALVVPLALGLSVVLGAASALACDVDSLRLRKGVDATTHTMGPVAKTVRGAVVKNAAFVGPKPGKPSTTSFSAVLTRNPDTALVYEPGFTTPADTCAPPVCKEVQILIPKGSDQTLYARISWPKSTQYAHLWAVAPNGEVIGNSDVAETVDKSVGNTDVLPISEFTKRNPAAGLWRLQMRAVFGVNIPITGYAALSKGAPLIFPRLDVKQLADAYLHQDVTYNIVLVNRKWSKEEIEQFRSYMPLEYREAVLTKQSSDGPNDNPANIVLNWGINHYSGTDGKGNGGYVPYFEPLKFAIKTRFLQADDVWTEDLFAAMKKATKPNQPFNVVPGIGIPKVSQGQYLAQYDAVQGKQRRGVDHVVTNPTAGDKIDGFAVEDWVFGHRYDDKYAHAFTDVDTGKKVSGAFITPDPGAYYDAFYTRTGKKQLDRMPQGPVTSWTFFALDTFNGPLADKYFNKHAYHFFDLTAHYIDPDAEEPDAPDYARVWGGRYHFFLHDLGAGPNTYEAVDFFLGRVPGSAAYPLGDPPIWDYDNDPKWAGKLPARTARDAVTMIFGRYAATYLYRPIPADTYVLANNNWSDCYSRPTCSPDGISHTDLTKVYDAKYAQGRLESALPTATFLTDKDFPTFKVDRYLGCSKKRAVANPDPAATGSSLVILAPNPLCRGASDPLQEMLELAKARGDELVGAGVNDLGASPQIARKFIEENRDTYAPQPTGAFTLLNLSVVFPGLTTWALPAITGGVSFGTPNEEAYGDFNNVNERFKTYKATDCAKSRPIAPGCNGVPAGTQGGGTGFSYTISHESSHFLGLAHPHDMLTVEKDVNGKWQYYGDTYRHYGDFTAAPTTYAGAFGPYTPIDQDTLQRGHTAEYLRQQQGHLADAWLQDGAAGLTKISDLTDRKYHESEKWRAMATTLHACGDYLHAERAMRNAALTASGVFGPVVEPRNVALNEKVLFKVNPQPVFGPDGGSVPGCAAGASVVPPGLGDGSASGGGKHPGQVANRRPVLATTGVNVLVPVLALALVGAALVTRRRTRRA